MRRNRNATPSEFMARLASGFEGDCPTCGRFSKVWARSIDSTMSTKLIYAWLRFQRRPFTTRDLVTEGKPANGFAGLFYWGLIKPVRIKNYYCSKRKKVVEVEGWKITYRGERFIRSNKEVPKVLLIFDNHIRGWDKKKGLVSIKDTLNKKFDMEDLLSTKVKPGDIYEVI